MVVQKSSSVSKDIAAAALVMTIATANRQEGKIPGCSNIHQQTAVGEVAAVEAAQWRRQP